MSPSWCGEVVACTVARPTASRSSPVGVAGARFRRMAFGVDGDDCVGSQAGGEEIRIDCRHDDEPQVIAKMAAVSREARATSAWIDRS